MTDDELADDFQRIGAEYARLLADIAQVFRVTFDEAADRVADLARLGWTWEREVSR